MSDNKNPLTIIIGAGLAGLTAAYTLHKNNSPVLVLEARDRIGGRLWSIDRVDLGAQWIHGTEGNPINNFVREHSIPCMFIGGDSTYIGGWEHIQVYYPGGQKLTHDEKWRCILLWDEVQEWLDATRRQKIENNEPDCSMLEALENVFKEHFPHLTPLEKNFISWHAFALARDDCSAKISDLSSLYWDDGYEVYAYGDSILLNGYADIVNKLAEGLKIKTNQIVTSIDYSDEKNIIVTTTTEKFVANKIIVTLPLGVLKEQSVQFIPELPLKKQQAIQRLGFGCLVKIVLYFDQIFWPKDQYVIGFLSNQVENSPTQIINLWKYRKIPALVLLIGGHLARDLEQKSEAEITSWSMGILRSIFGPDISNPTKLICTQWGSDPFSRGTYTYMAVGATPKNVEELAEPIQSRIYFAGEATSRQFWGAAHAAYVTGLNVAAELLANPALLTPQHFSENRRWRDIMLRVSRFLTMKKREVSELESNWILSILKQSAVFSSISLKDLQLLTFMFEVKQYQNDDIICRQSEKAHDVYIIAEGTVFIQLEGAKHIIRTKGSVVGEYGLFLQGNRTATLIAQGEVKLLCLDYQRFYQFLQTFPQALFKLSEYIVKHHTDS